MDKITGYELSRNWFDWCFENPDIIKPSHTALYFFAIEHRNRMGWKEKFGLPTEMAKAAIGIKSWHTYIETFNDLVDWGFFKLIERSKNQFSSNIIALSKNIKAHNKALDKAIAKHASKHQQSTHQSIDSIVKPINYITKEPINKGTENTPIDFSQFEKWSEQILTDIDFKNLLYRDQINCSAEKLIEAMKDHLNLLSRYPNMQPTDFKRFRHSAIKHLKEFLKKSDNGKQQIKNPYIDKSYFKQAAD